MAQTRVQDIFGRSLNQRGLTLVDRDGYMANPLIKFYLMPPANAALPGSVTLSANDARLYFNNPGSVSAAGPATTRPLTRRNELVPVKLSIFPGRRHPDHSSTLTIVFTDAHNASQTNTLPITIIDQNTQRSNDFHVSVNFDRDVTQFFTNPIARLIVQQAADDWAYFFAGMNLDPVPVGAEKTWTGDSEGCTFTNTNAYTGFLLYAHGVTNSQHISGGNAGGEDTCQSSGGRPLPFLRSGDYAANIAGDYNTLGWLFLTNDDDWLASSNEENVTNDFYSVARHEIGHALIFHDSHPGFPVKHLFRKAAFTSAAVRSYYGRRVVIDADDHLEGAIDPESGRPAFGNEPGDCDIPSRRSAITKLDLLCAQELGYTLRANAAFAPLAFPAVTLPRVQLSLPFTCRLTATGGVPIYNWDIASGALPPGFGLDPFTGVLAGTPTSPGTFKFSVRVRDYREKNAGVTQAFNLVVP